MENQRIRLSKTMLRDALVGLLQEKPLSRISVLEICGAAEINRTTFYKYYGSQEDLLADVERCFLGRLDEKLLSVAGRADAVASVLSELLGQRTLFCTLVRALPGNEFASHMSELPSINALFGNLASGDGCGESQAGYLREFVFQGTFAVLYSWLDSEEPEPVSEIARTLDAIRIRLSNPARPLR